jgi:hypothetical protein
MVRVYDAVGQPLGEHRDHVRAVHAEHSVPPPRVRREDRCDEGAVVPEVAGLRAHPGTQAFDLRAQPGALELTDAVGSHQDTGPDLSQRRGLLVNRHLDAALHQRVRCEEAADSPTHDDDAHTAHLEPLFRYAK